MGEDFQTRRFSREAFRSGPGGRWDPPGLCRYREPAEFRKHLEQRKVESTAMDRNQQILELATTAGELLLRNGAEIFRVQDTMEKIAGAYGAAQFHVYVISNGIFASVGEGGPAYSTQIRNVPLSPVHLGRVAAVNQLSRRITAGELPLEEALREMHAVAKIPCTAPWLQVLAAGVGSACFCILFGGSLFDGAASFLSGVLLWMFVLWASGKKLSKIVTNLLGSTLVTVCGLALFHLGMGSQMDKIIIGSIIPLVPGVPLTTAVRDFFNSDYLSGTIHLIDAVLIAACIAIGVGAVLKGAAFLGAAV